MNKEVNSWIAAIIIVLILLASMLSIGISALNGGLG